MFRNNAQVKEKAQIFAALGDENRLALVRALADGEEHSIANLSEGAEITRQAITKHLRVLEDAGIVHSKKSGRESMFRLDIKPMDELTVFIAELSVIWDQRLSRLKSFLED